MSEAYTACNDAGFILSPPSCESRLFLFIVLCPVFYHSTCTSFIFVLRKHPRVKTAPLISLSNEKGCLPAADSSWLDEKLHNWAQADIVSIVLVSFSLLLCSEGVGARRDWSVSTSKHSRSSLSTKTASSTAKQFGRIHPYSILAFFCHCDEKHLNFDGPSSSTCRETHHNCSLLAQDSSV